MGRDFAPKSRHRKVMSQIKGVINSEAIKLAKTKFLVDRILK